MIPASNKTTITRLYASLGISQSLCRVAREVSGRDYRLLSEAEWEYAARGETAPGLPLYFGNDDADLGDYAIGATSRPSIGATRAARRCGQAGRGISPTRSASLTFSATSMSGRRTATTTVTTESRSMALPGHPNIVKRMSFAGVPGSTGRAAFARRAASGKSPSTRGALAASVLPGRYSRCLRFGRRWCFRRGLP